MAASASLLSSCSSLTLGTMSDRKSMSSEVMESDCAELKGTALLRRPKRPRKRDTADGAAPGGASVPSRSAIGASA